MFGKTEGGGARGETTLIARGVKVEGEFHSPSDVVIEGEVHGTLTTQGALTVGSEAKIKADVRAQGASVSGTIEGNVVIAQRLDVKSSARLIGDITAETIGVEAGATISGRMSIGVKPAEAPASTNRRERAQASAAL